MVVSITFKMLSIKVVNFIFSLSSMKEDGFMIYCATPEYKCMIGMYAWFKIVHEERLANILVT